MSSSGGPSARPTYEQTVWSWTEHLRAGGTTAWADWVATEGGTEVDEPPGWTPPGAAQVELLRRLWLERRPDEATRVRLAELVLARSGPGRGLAQQPLSWPDASARQFGAPAVDPAAVPDEELLRIGVGTLADLLLDVPPPVGQAAPRRRLFTRTPPFVLAGAPVTTSVVRRDLAVAGHVEGGHAPVVLLFAEPLDRALAEVWTARVQRGAAVRWPGFVDRWAHRRTLPPTIDVASLARSSAERVGADKVHVLVDPGGREAAARSAAEVLGVPYDGTGVRAGSRHPRVWPLSPEATDVARRVNAVLHLRVSEERRSAVAGILSVLLARCDDAVAAGALTVPTRFRGWLEDTAARQAERVIAGGYPVHGEPARLVPASHARPTRPDVAGAVRVVLRACLDQAARNQQARRTEER